MACSIVATVGSATANSYCTIAEADAFHSDQRLHASDWEAATTDTKCRALRWAARLLDEQIEWEGDPTDDVQVLQWPRTGLLDALDLEIETNEIPASLKNAQAELARLLIVSDRTLDQSSDGIDALSVGEISIDFSEITPPRRIVIPDSVFEMIALWGERKFRTLQTARLIRT